MTNKQIGLLRAWIDKGAVWTGGVAAVDPKKKHWAFQSVERPKLPQVKDSAWPRNPIDRFILARLEQVQLSPSPQAERLALLRRLKFDLLGLPPTLQEVDAWLSNRHNG